MAKQNIPSINIPIQKIDGSIEWTWYLYLQSLINKGGGSSVRYDAQHKRAVFE